jgi:ABC-2 type transport system ATP-binding protein
VTLRSLLDDVARAGLTVLDIGLRRPTLDDVFLTLTGHTAEEAADEPEMEETEREVA